MHILVKFDKISTEPFAFDISRDGVRFAGTLRRVDRRLVACSGKLSGNLAHICDRCGKDLEICVDESVEITLCDGIFKDAEGELSDVIEFFDGEIDIDEIFTSEVEALKCDYFYCDECK